MRAMFGVASIAAIVVTAACSRGEEMSAPTNQASIERTSPDVSSNAAESIRARQSRYKQFGRAMKGISDELKAGDPSVQAIQEHATRLRDYAPQIAGWFPHGSGSEAGLETRAKQEIWSDPEGFRHAAEAFVAATRRFDALAAAGDMSAIRSGVRDLQQACKSCHDDYRAPKE